jgi:diacylglycerol kinase (ATP)
LPGDVALIVNPSSGRGKAGRLLESIRERLGSLAIDVEVLASRSAAHATELAAGAAQRHAVVAAMGGDGMVALVANGLLGTEATLGIVPAGSGNDFASALGYARRRAVEACSVLARGRIRTVDVGRIEGGPAFLCVAGGGFDSEVNRVANEIRWARGTLVYVVAVLATLRRFRPVRFRVELDGAASEFEGMFVAVGNGPSYGGGMRIAPDAELDDGLFDVCLVGAMSRPGLLRQFPRLFRGTHVTHPAVDVRRARRVRIESDRPFALYADGEDAGSLPASMAVEPKVLKVLVP